MLGRLFIQDDGLVQPLAQQRRIPARGDQLSLKRIQFLHHRPRLFQVGSDARILA